MTGQDFTIVRFTEYTLVTIALALIAQSQGLLIGAFFMEDASSAVFLGPISAIPFLLFAGFFVRIKTIPFFFKPMAYISYLRYAFEGLIAVLYGYGRCPFDLSLANQTQQKPEWLDYLTQLLSPEGENPEGGGSFVEKMLKNLGGQTNNNPDGSDYQSAILTQFDITEDVLIYNSFILVGFFVGFRIITYLVLLWKVNSHD